MTIVDPNEWLQSDKEKRAKLYPVAKAIKDMLRLDNWNAFLALALENPVMYSSSYGGLFRSGRISRQNAYEIYNWIAANHAVVGRRLASDLFPISQQTAWDGFITGDGCYGLLKATNPSQLALTTRDDDLPIEEESIHFGQAYCFELLNSSEGHVLMFESHEGNDWYPVALGATKQDISAPVSSGRCLLPWDVQKSKAITLRERLDKGLRQFVLIHGSHKLITELEDKLLLGEPIHETTLNMIASTCQAETDGDFTVHRLNVVFVQ